MSSTVDKQILALWQMVIQQIQPREVGVALELYCELVEFDLDNKTANIHVEHKSVIKVINAEIPKLESAFEAVLRDSIKIHLEVSQAESESVEQAKILTDERYAWSKAVSTVDATNQGLGASYQWNGLNFRSKSEIKIAQALDERGVLYFPNARGRLSLNYRRVNREADFLICCEGRWGILECDGGIYHQTAADDHARDLLWNAHGVWFIKRFSSSECHNNPTKVVDLFLEMLRLFSEQNAGGRT